MVKTTTAIRTAVDAYVKNLEKDIRVDKVVLFGSYANGNPRAESDIDIAIISNELERYKPLEKIYLLADRRLGCDTQLAPLGYTLQQYQSAERQSFIGEIKRTGKVIWERKKLRKRKPLIKPRSARPRRTASRA